MSEKENKVFLRGSMRVEIPFDKVVERKNEFVLYRINRRGSKKKIAVYQHNYANKEKSVLLVINFNEYKPLKIEISESKSKKLMAKFRKKIKEESE